MNPGQTNEQKLYERGSKEFTNLTDKYDAKANNIISEYQKVVGELGYSDRELADSTKAKHVAMIMFDDQHLGKDYKDMTSTEKYVKMENDLGMTADKLAGAGGMIERSGGMGLVQFANWTKNQYFGGKINQQLSNLVWESVYDPTKSIQNNIDKYAAAINEDAILSGTGKKIDTKKFHSIDDAANVLVNSMQGQMSRDVFQNSHGVDFN